MEIDIELPDDLLHRANLVAAQRGASLSELVIEGLEELLAAPPSVQPVQLTPKQAEIFEIDPMGIPVLKKRDAVVTNEMINQMREDLGI